MKWLYLLVLPLAVGVPWVGATAYYEGRILPNVFVGDVALGGLTPDEAQKALEGAQFAPPNVKVKWAEGVEGSSSVSADQLGWKTDLKGSLEIALALGKNASLLEHLRAGKAEKIPLKLTVDQDMLRAKLQSLTQPLEQLPVSAKAIFIKTKYEIKADVVGKKADVDSAVVAYAADPTLLELKVTFKDQKAKLTAEDLKSRVDQANALIRPFKLIYPVVNGQVISNALTPMAVANLFWLRATLEPDMQSIASSLKAAGVLFDRAPKNASYRFAGNSITRVKEENGYALDMAAAKTVLAQAILDPSVHEVLLPVTETLPTLTLSQLPDPKSLQLLSSATTHFGGSSAERSANVYAAATHLDGTVVPMGEVFSFLDSIGSISLATGYRSALVISGGRTVEGVGGGVCQVSTTTFRALYSAGLPVVSRSQHAYRVHWYEPLVGFEAAVYQPGVDLKMKNDTPAPLIIRASPNIRGGSLTVSLYGIPDGRKVSISSAKILSRTPHPPAQTIRDASLPAGTTKQVDWAVDGFHVQINRTVSKQGNSSYETLDTRYKPWRAVYAVGG